MRHAWLPLTAAAAALATLIGCGGSTGDSSASNPPAGGGSGISTTEQATARIDVDLIAGTTNVTPMNAAQSRSLFTGSSVSVTASPVSTQPGELTVKKVRLNIKNNTADAIGLDDDVLLVVDRVATDDLGGLNLREFSNVATVIGPGSSANDGPGSTVTISQPSGVDVDSEGTLYVAGQGDGSLRKLRDDYVTRIATGLATPGGVAALPGSDFLFVTEQSTHNIVRVPKTGGAKFVIAGGGAAGLTDGSGAAARFNLPRDIAIIGSSDLCGRLHQ